MAGFLYYLPGVNSVTASQVTAAGLDYALADVSLTCRGVQNGPGGNAGCIVAGPNVPEVGYYPQRQKWRKVPGREAWVGMDREQPPTPDDLRRPELIVGYPLLLGDGNLWLIPVARQPSDQDGGFSPSMFVPHRLELNDEGEFIPGEVLPPYRDLDTAAGAYAEAWLRAKAGGAASFEHDDQAAVVVLAANYRISRVEVVMLGLWHYQGKVAQTILGAAIDLPGWFELRKKAEAAGSSIADGPAATP